MTNITRRQSNLIEALTLGLEYKQIAAIAEVRVNTLKQYFATLRRKTGCETNAALVAWWCEQQSTARRIQ